MDQAIVFLLALKMGTYWLPESNVFWFRGESGVSYGVKGYDKTIAEENLCANEADLDKVKVVPYYEHPLC